jgi:hypothetical protein
VYSPADSTSRELRPAVLFVTGLPDAGAERMVGCKLKEMGSYISWAELMTTSGLVGITYTNGRDYLKCAVLCYGYMLDVTGSTWVADAAKQFGFVNPPTGKSVADHPRDLPLFIARRSGSDARAERSAR